MGDLNYEGEDFNSFIRELIDTKRFSDLKEVGIAKLVIDKGISYLTEKQKYVFEKSIESYVFTECNRCHLEIPWSEMSAAEDNDGLCSWCDQLGYRDD